MVGDVADKSDTLTAVVTAVLLFVALAGVELIKMLIKRRNGDELLKKGHLKGLEQRVDSLVEVHAKHDNDGVPLVYVPRSMESTQQRMVAVLVEVSKQQADTARVLSEIKGGVREVDKELAKVPKRGEP
uniref:Uncharacterized protein n=1 Tax=viral metagenome TaxID=1070528 RepID=A0A6M3MAG2_9ZZZZ